MGWCDESGYHEGWIQAVFNDGTLSSGTSSGHGIYEAGYTYAADGDIDPKFLRPYSDIIAHQMACECGWVGTRVASADLAEGDIDPRWHEPTEQGEARFLLEWRRHVAPFNAVARLAGLADSASKIEGEIHEAVQSARIAGASWSQIGAELGVSKQAAQQKYGAA